jgi:hypothetical protein
VSFAAITLHVASQRVFIVVYFVVDSVRKLLDTPSYTVKQKQRSIRFNSFVQAPLSSDWCSPDVDWDPLVFLVLRWSWSSALNGNSKFRT